MSIDTETETTEALPFIGWIDQYGNILEESDAQERVDALNSGLDPDAQEEPYTLEGTFTKVRTADFWQAELDGGEDPGPQPEFEVIESSDAMFVADDGSVHATAEEARSHETAPQPVTDNERATLIERAEALMHSAAEQMRQADTLLQQVRYGKAAPRV